MRLRILLPTGVLLDEPVSKVTAEAENGSFCLKPRHIDFVAALVPGLLSYVSENGEERFVAVDEGTLIKCGPEVLVSVHGAACGELAELEDTVAAQFRELDKGERKARSALARLEAGVVRRFTTLGRRAS